MTGVQSVQVFSAFERNEKMNFILDKDPKVRTSVDGRLPQSSAGFNVSGMGRKEAARQCHKGVEYHTNCEGSLVKV